MYFILKTHTALDISVSFDLQRVVQIENEIFKGAKTEWSFTWMHQVLMNKIRTPGGTDQHVSLRLSQRFQHWPCAGSLSPRSGAVWTTCSLSFSRVKPERVLSRIDRPPTHLTPCEPTRRSHIICDDLLWLPVMKWCIQALLPAHVRSRCLWTQSVTSGLEFCVMCDTRSCVQRLQQQHLCNQPPRCVENFQPFSCVASKHELKLARFR